MDFIHYEASKKNSSDATNAMMAVQGITSVRGAAMSEIHAIQDDGKDDVKEVDSCLNTVTCRIM